MGDMHENGLWTPDKQASSQETMKAYRAILAASIGATEPGEAMTADLPDAEQQSQRALIEVPATSTLFPSLWVATADNWITEQPTWVLPAVSKSPKADKQALPIVQEQTAKKEQTSSSAQSYLSLALDMIKNSGIYAVGAL